MEEGKGRNSGQWIQEWPTSESKDENSKCFCSTITNVIILTLKSG